MIATAISGNIGEIAAGKTSAPKPSNSLLHPTVSVDGVPLPDSPGVCMKPVDMPPDNNRRLRRAPQLWILFTASPNRDPYDGPLTEDTPACAQPLGQDRAVYRLLKGA